MKRTSNKETEPYFAESLLKHIGFLGKAWSKVWDFFTSNRLFWGALTLYVIVQVAIVMPLLAKSMPPGGDDGYSYIYRAAQLRDCPLQDCKAIDDLREQFLLPADDLETAAIRNRQFTRLVVFAHPLYAAGLLLISSFGLSLESAFDILFALTKVLVPFFVAYWIYALWGRRTATVALFLLAPITFISHGLSLGVPSVLALGVACLLWGLILTRHSRLDYAIVPLSVVVVLMHSMGVLYVAIALCLYLLLADAKIPRKVAINSGLVLLICIITLVLPKIVLRPTLEFSTLAFYPGTWSYLQELKGSIDLYAQVLQHAALYLPQGILLFVLLWLGIRALHAAQRFKVLLTALSILALLAFGIFYAVPWYGGFTFVRIWPLAAVFMIALASNGFIYFAELVAQTNKDEKNKLSYVLGIAFLLILTTSLLKTTISTYWSTLASQLSLLQSRDNYINPQQISLLNDTFHDPNGAILYLDEVGLYYFLSHGALDKGAIYEPALKDHDQLEDVLENAAPVTHVVQRNLLYNTGMPLTSHFGIILQNNTQLLLRSSMLPINNSWEVYIEETKQPLILRIDTENESFSVIVEPGPARWLPMPEGLTDSSTLGISPDGEVSIAISGARPSTTTHTQWLWDTGFSLEYVTTENRYHLSFESSQLANAILGQLNVVDDYGYLTLATTKP